MGVRIEVQCACGFTNEIAGRSLPPVWRVVTDESPRFDAIGGLAAGTVLGERRKGMSRSSFDG